MEQIIPIIVEWEQLELLLQLMVQQQYRLLDQEPRMQPRREDSQLVLRNLSQQGKLYNI
jgi:hypothetical protein